MNKKSCLSNILVIVPVILMLSVGLGCNIGTRQQAQEDVLDHYYYQKYQTAMMYAEQWKNWVETYYTRYGRYPSKSWTNYGWGTCSYPDGDKLDAAYCCVYEKGTATSAGGFGMVLDHAASNAGKSYCWANNTAMSQICFAETGVATKGQRNFY